MAMRFPSLEFWQALERLEQEKPISLLSEAGGDALIGLSVDEHAFMLEFEDGVCEAVALGGNPNDMDFTLSGPEEAWRELFARIGASDDVADCFEDLVGPSANIQVESLQDEGIELFASRRPLLEAFFAEAGALEID